MMVFDPLAEERLAGGEVLPRAANGNPMIVPRGETMPVEYTRASAMADFLAHDIIGLKKWEIRYLIPWLARSPDLIEWAATLYYSTGPLTGTLPMEERKRIGQQIDQIASMVLERAAIHEAANVGSAIHEVTVPGHPGAPLHPKLAAATKAYHQITSPFTRVASEVFVVNDELKVGGTFDSGYLSPEYPGCVLIGDTKSGKSVHQAEFEIQLACYSRGEVYLGSPVSEGWDSPGTDAEEVFEDQRLTFEEFFGLPVNQKVAYLVHVPVEGAPKPRVIKMDLVRGWDLAQKAAEVRDARKVIDKTGLGEKVDVVGLAHQEKQRLLELGRDWHRSDVMTDDEFRQYARELYSRFEHVWDETDTLLVKGRLS
jgi:hypothetical protein